MTLCEVLRHDDVRPLSRISKLRRPSLHKPFPNDFARPKNANVLLPPTPHTRRAKALVYGSPVQSHPARNETKQKLQYSRCTQDITNKERARGARKHLFPLSLYKHVPNPPVGYVSACLCVLLRRRQRFLLVQDTASRYRRARPSKNWPMTSAQLAGKSPHAQLTRLASVLLVQNATARRFSKTKRGEYGRTHGACALQTIACER